jgi:gliding motility-associated-like protein
MKTIFTLVLFLASTAFVHSQIEICDNGIDDDNDGLIDYNDTVDCFCDGITGTTGTVTVPPSMIPNSNFDSTVCCPTTFSQLNCATGWIQATSPTSDFLHTCGYYPANLPLPPSGSGGVVGAIIMPGYLEYVGSCLTAPMLAGTQYTFEIQIACEPVDNFLGSCGQAQYSDLDMTIYGNVACASMPVATNGCPPDADPSWLTLAAVTYTPDSLWSTLAFTFTPTVDINAIIIGAPCGVIPPDYGTGFCLPYFIMDDLTLNTSSSFSSGIGVSETGGFLDSTIVLTGSPDTIDPNSSYQWFLDGVAIDGETDTVLSLMPYICLGGSGVFTLVQVLNAECVTVDFPFNFPNQIPTPDFNVSNSCVGAQSIFTDASVANGSAITVWDWDFGNNTSSTLQNPTQLFASEGAFTVELILTTEHGCMDSISKVIEIYPIPVPAFDATEICLGGVTQFVDNSTISSGATPNSIITWDWTFGDPLNGVSTNTNPVYIYTVDGIFPVTLIVNSDNGCADTLVVDVAVHPLPIVNFEGPVDTCAPANVTFINTTTINSGIVSLWEWEFGDEAVSNEQHPSHSFENTSVLNVNTFDVTLTATSDQGCVTTLTQPGLITAYPEPAASFEYTPISPNIHNDNVIFTDLSSGAVSWTWYLGEGDSIYDVQHPEHTYSDTGSYYVMLAMENAFGCRDTMYQTVDLNPVLSVWIPNAFTPNGDGFNDFFFADGYGITDITSQVYNRWGQLIWEGDHLDAFWDGTYRGELVEVGTYVYKIHAKDMYGGKHEYVGHVTLLQ